MLKQTFRSLANRNYRLWAAGAFVSNIGTWMQRTAQNWIVLAELTSQSATAVGVVMALQFGPSMLLLPFTGFAADHFDRRKLLLATQAAQGLLALVLGFLTITGNVQLWHVYLMAFLLGCVTAFDAPARQTFVAELVSDAHLSNAVALNSTSFNTARMIGPAVAGLLIAVVGTGWIFVMNGASFLGPVVALCFLRVEELHRHERSVRKPGSFLEGFRYVAKRPELMTILAMLFLIMTFGLNFQVFVSAMAITAFHADAGAFGLLMSVLAIGSVAGALSAARREKPRLMFLLGGAAMFGAGLTIAALMPTYALFAISLIVVGWSAQTFNTTANSSVQLLTEPTMRGRVMAIYMAISMGCTPLGAPLVGWVADRFGPRWSLVVGAASGLAAAAVAVAYLVRYRGLRVRLDGWIPRIDMAHEPHARGRADVRIPEPGSP